MKLLTEEEAAEKWCPKFQAAIATNMSDGIEVFTNRNGVPGSEDGKSTCIGSRCMAWRGDDIYSNDVGMRVHRGYCGAFGKIET